MPCGRLIQNDKNVSADSKEELYEKTTVEPVLRPAPVSEAAAGDGLSGGGRCALLVL